MNAITLLMTIATFLSTNAFSPSNSLGTVVNKPVFSDRITTMTSAPSFFHNNNNHHQIFDYTAAPSLSTLKYKVTEEDSDDAIRVVDNEEIEKVVLVEKEQLHDVVLTKKKPSRVIKSTPLKNVITVETLDEFTHHLDSNPNKLVVVRFFASWCKVRKLHSMKTACFTFCHDAMTHFFFSLTIFSCPSFNSMVYYFSPSIDVQTNRTVLQ